MKIYELLDRPEKWTQKTFARAINGESVHPLSPMAVCWCLSGAAQVCYRNLSDFSEVTRKLANKTSGTFSFNDNQYRTYDEVIALVKELDV